MSDLTGANAIDIIARLRRGPYHVFTDDLLWDEAADLIEALCAELARMAEDGIVGSVFQPRVTEEIAESIIDCYEAMLAKAASAGKRPLAARKAWAKQAAIVLQVSPFGMRDEAIPPGIRSPRKAHSPPANKKGRPPREH